MKKLVLSVVFAVLISGVCLADPFKVNFRVKNAFEAMYHQVQDVQWRQNGKYVIASFNYEEKNTRAFFDHSGNFIGASYPVAPQDLPLTAKKRLAKKFSDFQVLEAIFFQAPNEIYHCARVFNNGQTLILKLSNNGITVIKKM